MLEAILGAIAGAVLGVLVGGTGKYWGLRRDAWTKARTSGLLLLADVRALLAATTAQHALARTRLGVESWEAQRETLAGFRRGNFPNGYKAPEWLELAAQYSRLELLLLEHEARDDALWADARATWTAIEKLLVRFEDDPRVAAYVLMARFRR